jgi:hypothetical protein
MAYNYQKERPRLFTEDGQTMLVTMRDTIQRKVKVAGAVTARAAMSDVSGDTWMMLAVLDRLMEMGDIRRIEQRGHVAGQDEVYVWLRG